MKAKPRTANRNKKRGGRRRRKNTTTATARIAAPNTTARFTNRSGRKTTHRRKRNGVMNRVRNAGSASTTGIVIAGLGILGFDLVAQKVLGNQSAAIGAATKIGGGYLLSNSGRKLPVIGKHAELIGSGLILIGVVDLLRIFVWPKIVGFLPAQLLPAPPQVAAGNGVSGLVNAGPRLYRGMSGLVNLPSSSPLTMY